MVRHENIPALPASDWSRRMGRGAGDHLRAVGGATAHGHGGVPFARVLGGRRRRRLPDRGA
eukprot:5654726-Pyramimonas_sp.AAC.1